MTKIWNSDHVLYHATKTLCGDPLAGATRKNFLAGNLRMATRNEKLVKFLDDIAITFRIDQHSMIWPDMIHSLSNLLLAQDVIFDRSRTYAASDAQILWANLGYDLMASLGRTYGFWCVDGITGPEMPDGPQWFLPTANVDGDRLVLPVEKVCHWWLDQARANEDKIWLPDRARSFSYWKSGKHTPEFATIWALFGPGQQDELAEKLPHLGFDLTEVRNQFLVARALETAFVQLAEALTPDVNPRCPDPKRNKALQLCELFRLSCQLTVDAGGGNPTASDARFRQSVPRWLMEGPLRCIYPFPNGLLAPEVIADQLTDICTGLVGDEGLWDIFSDMATCQPSRSAPQDVEIAAQREAMANLISDAHRIWFGDNVSRQGRFAGAITQVREHPLIDEFRPDLEYLRALDAISRGEFDAAQKHTDAALAACEVANCGLIKAECARLAFSAAVAQAAFDEKNEKYFRVISRNLSSEEFEKFFANETDEIAPFEHALRQAAVYFSERFWANFARPYEGRLDFPTPLEMDSEMVSAYFDLMFQGDVGKGFDAWRKTFRDELRTRVRAVRGDTFIGMIMKLTSDVVPWIDNLSLETRQTNPASRELAQNARNVFLKLAETSDTKSLNQADFKKQTPLMLAAVDGDLELVRILLSKHVDLDKQETLGRTAMHAAVLGGHDDCFNAILDSHADPFVTTCSGNTLFELAAELGRCDMFIAAFGKHRKLKMENIDISRIYKQVSDICDNYKNNRIAFAKRGRKIGPKAGYLRLRSFLECQI